MNSGFKTGIKTGLLIYGIGIVLTVVVDLIVGSDYSQGPPFSAVPLFVTLLIGALDYCVQVYKAFTERSEKAEGELTVHAIAAVVVVIFIVRLINY